MIVSKTRPSEDMVFHLRLRKNLGSFLDEYIGTVTASFKSGRNRATSTYPNAFHRKQVQPDYPA
jgi:hypothetical protein